MQFRLRTLMIVLGFGPMVLYWLSMPTLNGRRYVAALNAGNYRQANRLCMDENDRFPGSWTSHKTFHPSAELMPVTWQDFRRGERRVLVAIAYGDDDGLVSCGVECCATARGIKIGMFMP